MDNYFINVNKNFRDALFQLDKNFEKCLIVIDDKHKLCGTLTDGDIRRALLTNINLKVKISKYIKKNPVHLKVKLNKNFDKEVNFRINNLISRIKDDHIDIIPVINFKKVVLKLIFLNNFKNPLPQKNLLRNISVLIMAGGQGSRLQPFSNYFPKPLTPVDGKTAVEKILSNFIDVGIKKFFMSIYYKKNLIKSYLKEANIYKINYIEEKEPMGTAGAIRMLKGKIDNDFFLINCDTILSINLNKFFEFHKKNNFDMTLVAASKNIKIDYGACEIKKNGELRKIKEKPVLNYLVSVGLYLLKPEIINIIPTQVPYNIDNLIEKLKKIKKKIGVFPIDEVNWIDTGYYK